MAPASSAGLLISQVYGGGGATTGSPTFSHDHVELFNAGSAAVSLSGLSLQYASSTGNFNSVKVFNSGTVPAGGRFLVVLGGGSLGAALPVAADETGTLNLSASAGKIALVQGSTALGCGSATTPCSSSQRASMLDLVGYGAANLYEGSAAATLSNTSAAVRKGAGCTDTGDNGSDLVAITPAPAPRNSASAPTPCTAAPSPSPAPSPAPAVVPIHQIQGTGAISPLLGQTVTTRGVITKVLNNGFFMQEPSPDGDPLTSEGILVYTGSAPVVSEGQWVQLTGTVDEFNAGAVNNPHTAANPVTELKNISALSVLASNQQITPLTVTFPEAQEGDLERHEGMLVTIPAELTVSQNYFLGRYGQVTLSAGGRLRKATNLARPGSAQANAINRDNAQRRILLDDGTSQQNPHPTPYMAADGTLRAGDTLPSLTGVLDHGLATASNTGLADYKIHPVAPLAFERVNQRSVAPDSVGGNLKVASFNVLNYFNGDGAGGGFPTARGATNAAELARQRAKIVAALKAIDADVVGLMEIENDGTGATSAVADLVNALNAQMGPSTYAVVPDPASGTGTDEIKVAMIYKPSRVTRVGDSVSDSSAIHNRPPLAQTFAAANGERLTVVVNHFKSKSCGDATGGDLDQGDGQGCYNPRRVQQAQALQAFIADRQAAVGDADVLVIGDLNAYAKEDPIHHLTQAGFVDLVEQFSGEQGYSYVFDGEAGYLDHALASASLRPQVTGALEWHINADEPAVIDYNTEFKQPACGTCGPDYYTATPYRSSDHDPVVIGVNLLKRIEGSAGRDTLTGTAGDDVLRGGEGADTLTTGAGRDLVVLAGIRDGMDTVTDFAPGLDRLDMATLLASLGVAPQQALGMGVVRLQALSQGVQVLIDADGASGPQTARPLVLLRGLGLTQIDATRDLGL